MKTTMFFLLGLLAGKVRYKYRCTQTDLYAALLMACESFLLFQSRFAAFSTKYTTAWGENLRDAVLAAMHLPDFDDRNAVHEKIRANMFPAADKCLILFQELKSHIISSFPAIEHKAMIENAGGRYYRKAVYHEWDSVVQLVEAASDFIDANLATLTAGGMPVSFQDNFSTAAVEYEALHTAFANAEQQAWEAREAKVAANNAVYKTTLAMLRDGRKIFRLEESIRKRFIFSKILEVVHGGDGSATPVVPKVRIKTNGGPVNFGARLLGILNILWGDGTSVDFTGDPNATNFIDKVYAVLKSYTIVITGKISEIIELHISNSNLTYINLHKSMKKIEMFIAQGNQFPTKVVDDILITINSFQTSGAGRVINLLGSEPPSAAGLAAKAELEARGWMVLVSS